MRDVTVGEGSAPAAPSGINIIASDSTSTHLTWISESGAIGHQIWPRNTFNPSGPAHQYSADNGTKRSTCADDHFIFLGTRYYEFCISGFNSNFSGPLASFVMALSPVSGTCTPPPAFCLLRASCTGTTNAPMTTLSIPRGTSS